MVVCGAEVALALSTPAPPAPLTTAGALKLVSRQEKL